MASINHSIHLFTYKFSSFHNNNLLDLLFHSTRGCLQYLYLFYMYLGRGANISLSTYNFNDLLIIFDKLLYWKKVIDPFWGGSMNFIHLNYMLIINDLIDLNDQINIQKLFFTTRIWYLLKVINNSRKESLVISIDIFVFCISNTVWKVLVSEFACLLAGGP